MAAPVIGQTVSQYRIPVFGSALEGGESYESKVQWP